MQAARRFLSVGLISALSILGLAASAAPARARVISNEPFHESDSEVVEDCGLTLRIDIDIEGRFIINTHGREGLVYAVRTQHGRVSYTNLANGETVTETNTNSFRILKVIDNGDGTLTVVQAFSGILKVNESNGKLIQTGTERIELLVDAGGTPTDPADDVILDTRVVKERTGRSTLPELCDVLQQFIG